MGSFRTRRARRRLAAGLAVAAAMAAPAAGAGASAADPIRVVAQPSAPAGVDGASAEARLLLLVNGSRAAAGLPPYRVDGSLVARAREHSAGMVARGGLFHRDLRQLGVCRGPVAENIAEAPTVEGVHRILMADAPHRDAILGQYDSIGIGVETDGTQLWATEVFCKGAVDAAPVPPPPALTAPAAPEAPAPAAEPERVVQTATAGEPEILAPAAVSAAPAPAKRPIRPSGGTGSPMRLL